LNAALQLQTTKGENKMGGSHDYFTLKNIVTSKAHSLNLCQGNTNMHIVSRKIKRLIQER